MGRAMRLVSIAMAALGLVTVVGGGWVVGDSLHAEKMIREVMTCCQRVIVIMPGRRWRLWAGSRITAAPPCTASTTGTTTTGSTMAVSPLVIVIKQ